MGGCGAARHTPRIQALHGYELPCILALPAAIGDTEFLDWIREQARPPAG